ncbi:MAG: ABC transporter ATP-binding protein [Chloroflexi bacterium]|nr:ABC transporter ATP-binding protein [Chloroflexota bacterium]
MSNGPVVEVTGLRKSYGALEALAGIDLAIEPGEVFALLGPNGAGKTTCVEILEGYRRRTGGEASVLGVDPDRGERRWRARIGIVLQTTTAFDHLTVDEVVAHVGSFYPNPLPARRVVDMVGLTEKRSSRCGSLSGGQKRRVEVALGFVGDPELIFLDEPTTGLDPGGRRQLWEVVEQFTALKKTVVLTTHYLDEAEALAGRVGVIVAGALVEVAPPRELGGRERALARVTFARRGRLAGAALPDLPGATLEGDMVTVPTGTPTAIVGLLSAWAAAHGEPELPALTVTRPSLEDIYLEMVGPAGHRDDGVPQ